MLPAMQSDALPLIFPEAIKPGDTIGVCTPSSPAYLWNEDLFTNGLKNLNQLGFKTKLGFLTEKRSHQGYRSGTAQDRAKEFMDLTKDPSVQAIMATIGGSNSASMIPYLDFPEIRNQRKIFCGYSDVTSLHLAILKFAGLSTLYGPAVMCWFGDWPNGCEISSSWFMDAASRPSGGPRSIKKPKLWSNHKRDWSNGDWKEIPREWTTNEGWKPLNYGAAKGQILALNLNTLLTSAGTSYWPDLKNKILLLEDMDAPHTETERSLRMLQFNGAFDQISGLIIGKPETYNQQGAPFDYDDLWMEILGKPKFPVLSQFDCGHTLPNLTVPQLTNVALHCSSDNDVRFEFL